MACKHLLPTAATIVSLSQLLCLHLSFSCKLASLSAYSPGPCSSFRTCCTTCNNHQQQYMHHTNINTRYLRATVLKFPRFSRKILIPQLPGIACPQFIPVVPGFDNIARECTNKLTRQSVNTRRTRNAPSNDTLSNKKHNKATVRARNNM